MVDKEEKVEEIKQRIIERMVFWIKQITGKEPTEEKMKEILKFVDEFVINNIKKNLKNKDTLCL